MVKPKKGAHPYAWEKAAFLEDANEDSRITSAAFRVLQKICTAFNRKHGYAECAKTFIIDRVPISGKTVQRARRLLLAEGRIFIVRDPAGRAATRYGVNWYFRGADTVRENNDGLPVLDCRTLLVEGTSVSGLKTVEGTSASPENDNNVPSKPRRVDTMSPKPFLSSKKKESALSFSTALPEKLKASPDSMVASVIGAAVEGGTLYLELRDEGEVGTKAEVTLYFTVDGTDDDALNSLRLFADAAGMAPEIDTPEQLLGARLTINGYNEGEPSFARAPKIKRAA